MLLEYRVDSAIKELGIKSTVVAEVSGLNIDSSHAELEEIKSTIADGLVQLDQKEIEADVLLESYRELVRGLGRSLKKFPPAAENLISQVRRTGRFPCINTVVDSYNTVVTCKKLALGVHDIEKLKSGIHFRISDGGEPFRAVGSEKEKKTQKGDFVYSDQEKVLAWLDSKDSDDAKVSIGTKNIVIVIQGTSATAREYNWAAAEEACELITRFCGGTYEVKAID